MRPLKYGIGIRPGRTISQVSERHATEFSPARRPSDRPGYISQPFARLWNAARWSGWNSWKPTTLIWCWARICRAPLRRWVPGAQRADDPPGLLCELPSRLKVAIVKLATGGSAIGLGRATVGLMSTAFFSSRTGSLPVEVPSPAAGTAVGPLLGTADSLGFDSAWALEVLSESLWEPGFKSPWNQ